MSDEILVIPAPRRRLIRFRLPEHGTGCCGYCGFNPEIDVDHKCDGFGHGLTEEGTLVDMGCRDCALGYFCEKAAWLLSPRQKEGVQ